MSLTFLVTAAPGVSNEFLGSLVDGMVTRGHLDMYDLGVLIREGLKFAEPPSDADITPDVPTTVEGDGLLGVDLPRFTSLGRQNLLSIIYDSYTRYRRRSLAALAVATGLLPSAVLELIDETNDFRKSVGRDSGKTYISINAGTSCTPQFEEAATDVLAIEVSGELPESIRARENLLRVIYDSYTVYRRRSLPALARITALRVSAVMELIESNADFRITTGRDSGEVYVSVRGISD